MHMHLHMSIFCCTFVADFKLRSYANITTYRGICAFDGARVAVAGPAADVLAAV